MIKGGGKGPGRKDQRKHLRRKLIGKRSNSRSMNRKTQNKPVNPSMGLLNEINSRQRQAAAEAAEVSRRQEKNRNIEQMVRNRKEIEEEKSEEAEEIPLTSYDRDELIRLEEKYKEKYEEKLKEEDTIRELQQGELNDPQQEAVRRTKQKGRRVDLLTILHNSDEIIKERKERNENLEEKKRDLYRIFFKHQEFINKIMEDRRQMRQDKADKQAEAAAEERRQQRSAKQKAAEEEEAEQIEIIKNLSNAEKIKLKYLNELYNEHLKEKRLQQRLNPGKYDLTNRAISREDALEFLKSKKEEAKRHYNGALEIHRRLSNQYNSDLTQARRAPGFSGRFPKPIDDAFRSAANNFARLKDPETGLIDLEKLKKAQIDILGFEPYFGKEFIIPEEYLTLNHEGGKKMRKSMKQRKSKRVNAKKQRKSKKSTKSKTRRRSRK